MSESPAATRSTRSSRVGSSVSVLTRAPICVAVLLLTRRTLPELGLQALPRLGTKLQPVGNCSLRGSLKFSNDWRPSEWKIEPVRRSAGFRAVEGSLA